MGTALILHPLWDPFYRSAPWLQVLRLWYYEQALRGALTRIAVRHRG